MTSPGSTRREMTVRNESFTFQHFTGPKELQDTLFLYVTVEKRLGGSKKAHFCGSGGNPEGQQHGVPSFCCYRGKDEIQRFNFYKPFPHRGR